MQRLKLKDELAITCKTVVLSLDVWTSKNHLSIISILGHWLTEEFDYSEKVLDFKELHGTHSGENLAAAVETTLEELDLELKLITITGDNASNNETLASELFHNLSRKFNIQEDNASGNNNSVLLYHGLDSYIYCLAYILNLIVKSILQALKSSNAEEANITCNNLQDSKSIRTQTAIARLYILAF